MKTLLLVMAFLCMGTAAYEQTTSATISGIVLDDKDHPLAGAAITVVLESTNTRYRVTSLNDGHFTVPNLRVGGPYTVTVTYVGFTPSTFSNLALSLGQNLPLEIKLSTENGSLRNVVVTSKTNAVFNNKRTGLSTQISSDQLRYLPTLSRSAQDYTRLTPSADGISFAGRNSQYNNFSLDGAVFNNPFGLDAATPGGQSDAQPISLDAIEQIQVSVAPYDVTQAGFTGAAVNTVTKSGTNQLKGTAYGFYRNQDLTGKKVNGSTIIVPDLRQVQTGFSLGGPLLRNKLFFFVNAELERRSDLGSNYLAARPGLTGSNVSRVTAADLDAVRDALVQRFQYNPGAYEGFEHQTKNQKGLAKLDWIINNRHTLTFTYNFLDASKDKPANPNAIGRRGPDQTTLQFYRSGYRINNKIQSFNGELKSNFNSSFANKLRVVYTAFKDTRDPFSSPFPVVNIDKDGVRYIVAGHEPFSINNKLNQYAFQATNHFNVYVRSHTLTFGASFEKFSFANSFNLNAYGGTFGDYASVQDFLTTVNSGGLDAAVAAAKNTFAANQFKYAYSHVGQAAVYAQDEWNLSRRLRLTYGVRMDMALYFDTKDKILPNKDAVTYYNENGNPVRLDNTQLPSQQPLFSPRIGFNYDVNGNKSLQVRGGSGLFTGRLPFVWIGNQVANPFTTYLNITAPNFKWPQVWRNNIGFDYQTPGGWIASVDVLYTKDLKAMMVRNYSLGIPSGRLQGVDQRVVYTDNDKVFAGGAQANAYVFTNVHTGYSFNISTQIQRFFSKGWYLTVGYNYLDAKDASSISAEISGDAFDRNPAIGNVNAARSTPSLYGNQHRFSGASYKKFTYGHMATTLSVFFQYAKGGRFTYTYSGDINNDGSSLNDLLYIPTPQELSNMTFSGATTEAQQAQRDAFGRYLAQDTYLSKHRGQYAEKYAILSPWYSEWDVRLLQDFNFKAGDRTHTLQFSADLVNAGNLLNSKWGVRQYPLNQQPVGVQVTNNTPVYSFDASQQTTFVNDFSLLSRWQLQFGLRYIF